MLVVDIKGLISDVRSASGLFMILSLIRQIGSEVEVRISGYDRISSICDKGNETLISATAGNFWVGPSRMVPRSIPGGVTRDFFRGSFRKKPCALR